MATAQHRCNPWCIDDVHAIFFDTLVTDRGGLQRTAEALAMSAGLRYIGHTEVKAPGGQATRGRIVIWGSL